MKGLSTRFKIGSGKFQLTEGEEKAKDNLFFFMNWTFKVRVYLPEFSTGLLWLIQRPSSELVLYRSLILGNLKKLIGRFVPNIKVTSLNAFYEREHKKYGVGIRFKYKDETEDKDLITFV